MADMLSISSLQTLSQQELVLPTLVQLLAIILIAPLAAWVARRLRQPAAVGWIAAGIILGPSFLGKWLPSVSAWIFHLDQVGLAPAATGVLLPHIFFILAEVGLLLLLFITGVEFNFGHLKKRGRAASLISLAGIVAPFILSLLVATWLWQQTAASTPWLSFSLFLGTAMSITALPILGQIMMELGISRTRLGAITISAGATDDAVGWILLATVTAIVKSNFDPMKLAATLIAALVFVAVMFWVVKPIVSAWISRRLAANGGKLGRDELAYLFVFILICGIITHVIGIFALFGAFLAGAVLSAVPGLREAVKARLQDVVTTFFLPIFFTYTGLHTNINALDSVMLWLLFGVVLVVAIAGKLGGCTLAARLSGLSWRESLSIGAMMNCRALMELIALNVGRSLGVIPDTVYSMLVFMALVTTVMTTPLLLWFKRGTELEEPIRKSGFLS
jgi:Kef-type K+ transport system membrane component KefB